MRFDLNPEKIIKNFFSPFIVTIFLVSSFIPLEKVKANPQIKPANSKDLYLYKGMGASYLCIASQAGIEFPKAVGVATATYVQVLEGKHGGVVEELGDEKLEREKLFAGAEFQIVTTAIQYCPDNVPKDVTKKVKKILKKNNKKK